MSTVNTVTEQLTRAGQAIEHDSFAIIDAEVPSHAYTPEQWPIVRRMIHANADFDFNGLTDFHPQAVQAGMAAMLRGGTPVVADVEMICSGLSQPRLAHFGMRTHQFISDADVIALAQQEDTTRAVQAMRKAHRLGLLQGAIVGIGNAPTALIELARLIAQEGVRPALVVGMPVGFVSAAESKDLIASQHEVPWLVIRGRKGGSTLVVAALHALLALDEQIRHLLGEIHAGGLTKYQFVGEPESEIVRLVEFAHHLPQEAEALEKKVRSAVVNVAACLRELRDGLFAFKRRMREFNRKISGRQLSDLAVFKIEPEDETLLVEAIELLINTAATVDSGETFELFNQQSVLDDDQLNRAKALLIEEGNARHGLRVADLFRLRFWVGKADREPEAFDDLDSAASNGTVLMAKLVTGLAMLHLMQDQRRPIQGICYLDEALALDARNQRSLIDTAAEFGFSLIFASPAPLTTVRYCVPIHTRNGSNQISRHSWQVIEPLDT